MMRTFQQACVGFILASMGITSANAGISIDSTRVIFEASDHGRGQSVGVSSTDSSTSPYLIKAQVTRDIEGKHAQTPFVTTPSLFRLEPGSTHQVLIVKKTGENELPLDRESVFYFRSVAMPAGKKQAAIPSPVLGGSIQVATAMVVKLFYRPSGLPFPHQQAMGMLEFSGASQGLKVTNPTPYYITLSSLRVGREQVSFSAATGNTLIAPFGSQVYPRAPHQGKVEWKAINDYGGTEVFYGSVR
ncbi:fimbrial biogenesis chaperone [Serratia fonticola]